MEFASIPIPSATPAAKPAAPQADAVTAEKAQEFEAMFLGQMVDEMLSTVDIGSFGGGHAEETWRSFLSNAIGESIAEQNSTGIARTIETAMQRYQTGADR
ncbi:rod-binding protein [Sulfitobacter sp. R18_1]|uniref:rod-binding protein n=1 Tax=Sulfitobacter sp. R18_1 TaxID=2821104 RepID=UPI001ADAD107|nr:rod-binding protein [Sulfitobacter sp. R18_1]MBO9429933.1 rod-binding protein [Sulfitobacter sp. R18_1]